MFEIQAMRNLIIQPQAHLQGSLTVVRFDSFEWQHSHKLLIFSTFSMQYFSQSCFEISGCFVYIKN